MEAKERLLLYRRLDDRYRRSSVAVNRLNLYLENDADPSIRQRAGRVVFDVLFGLFPADRYGVIIDLFRMKLGDSMLRDILGCLPGSAHRSFGDQFNFVAIDAGGPRAMFEKFFPRHDEIYARVYRKPDERSADKIEGLLAQPVKRDELAYVEGTDRYHAAVSLSLDPVFLGVFSRSATYEQAERGIREIVAREGFDLGHADRDDKDGRCSR